MLAVALAKMERRSPHRRPAAFRAMVKLIACEDSIRTFQVDQTLLRQFLASPEALEPSEAAPSDGPSSDSSSSEGGAGAGSRDGSAAAPARGDGSSAPTGGPDREAGDGHDEVVPQGSAGTVKDGVELATAWEEDDEADSLGGSRCGGGEDVDWWSASPMSGAYRCKRRRLDHQCEWRSVHSPDPKKVHQHLLDLVWPRLDAHSLAPCLLSTRTTGASRCSGASDDGLAILLMLCCWLQRWWLFPG